MSVLLCNTVKTVIAFQKYPLGENSLWKDPRNVASSRYKSKFSGGSLSGILILFDPRNGPVVVPL